MADAQMTVKQGYDSITKEIPLEYLNGTDKVKINFIDDYTKMGLEVTEADGTVKYYEVALTLRA